MNKIISFKYKNSVNDNSVLNKLSKRCSNVKFLRHSPGRKGSPQPNSTGSYDMTGRESEDLKREIGAPILISKTTFDADSPDYVMQKHIIQPSPDLSENEVFSDAATSHAHLGDIKFTFFAPDEKLNNQENNDYYDEPKPRPSKFLRKDRSKSATNLHKSELKVFLQKAPSLELNKHSHTEQFYDMPRKLHLQDNTMENNIEQNTTDDKALHNLNRSSTSVSNSDNLSMIYVSKNSVHKANKNGHSRESIGVGSSSDEDFDLKSASFQSLDARNLFLSIEELNEITKQINESEEFKHEIDLEYCDHRDKLKPDQRRITLLRNKNNRIINIGNKKDKISHAWSGLKNWIGEERVKFKDVMQKHASLQRVGVHGSVSGSNFVRNPEFFNRLKTRGNKFNGNRQSVEEETSQISSTISLSQTVRNMDVNSDSDPLNVGVNSRGNEMFNRKNFDDGSSGTRTNSRTYSSSDRVVLPKFVPTLDRQNSKTNDGCEGQNGFEELRRYVKQGGDFGKDLVTILQERVDAEQLYAKSLSKMASKLNKACREIPGTMADAWRGVATEMESRSEVHRLFSNSMIEEIVKPLKAILDNQHKTRKAIESTVDKSARILSEWRTSEAKAKKSSHTAARENEKLQDAMLDVRIQRSPSVAMLHHGNHKSPEKEIKSAEKDCVKLDNKRRKAEESVKRADVEYYTLCIRAERARVEWEMSVLRGSTILQNHENQRLASLKNYLTDYLKFSNQMNPSMNEIVARLTPHVNACNVQKDLAVLKIIRRGSEGPSEQLLPDFYCEHTTLAMNRERRKHALVKLLQLVRTDLERERKSRNGLKGLSQSLSSPENQNITDKLYHIRSMLTYLEGARFKLQSALLELDHKPRSAHPLAPHIQITRDRTGLQQSILKVPLWLKNGDEADRISQEYTETDLDIIELPSETCVDSKNDTLIKHFDRNFNRSKSSLEFGNKKKEIIVLSTNSKANTLVGSPVFDRGIADGGSNQPDSDFDEFSSQDEDEELSKKQAMPRVMSISPPVVISRCRALYSYSPKLYDELELIPGDLIDVHAKQEDGWWLGAIKNKTGIFPATYVEEIP